MCPRLSPTEPDFSSENARNSARTRPDPNPTRLPSLGRGHFDSKTEKVPSLPHDQGNLVNKYVLTMPKIFQLVAVSTGDAKEGFRIGHPERMWAVNLAGHFIWLTNEVVSCIFQIKDLFISYHKSKETKKCLENCVKRKKRCFVVGRSF